MSAARGGGIVYPSGAPEFIFCFSGSVLHDECH